MINLTDDTIRFPPSIMNERIKECWLTAARQDCGDKWDTQEEFIERFAKLIVRECVEQCNVNFVGTVGSHPNAHNRGVKKCIDNIKQHFGVE